MSDDDFISLALDASFVAVLMRSSENPHFSFDISTSMYQHTRGSTYGKDS